MAQQFVDVQAYRREETFDKTPIKCFGIQQFDKAVKFSWKNFSK